MVHEIKLGGKTRPISYTINALLDFEELTQIDLVGGDAEQRRQLTKVKNVRALAFVGLKHGARATGKDVDFTIEDVGDWISFNDGTIGEVMRAYQSDQPAPTDNEPQTEETKN